MDPERNLKLTIAYEGTDFEGWQYQPQKRTVQGVIQAAIREITKQGHTIVGAGRTDAGVHAIGQVANFKTTFHIALENLKRALNSLLPKDVYVRDIVEVPLEFHARYSAKAKVYEYRILQRKEPDVFMRRYVWHVFHNLRPEFLRRCLECLIGEHDFSSFSASGSSVKTFVRKMYDASLAVNGDMFVLRFKANGFLRHMVRNIVGTLIQLDVKGKDVDELVKIMEKKDRKAAGITAPPQGLYLVEVIY
jgi:tRNA pseudouridine38-40 synthase